MPLHIETPALLFSVTSLILLASTYWFLTPATIMRDLIKEKENLMLLFERFAPSRTSKRITTYRY